MTSESPRTRTRPAPRRWPTRPTRRCRTSRTRTPYTGLVNDFYNNVVGRKGIDGTNMPVVSSVRLLPRQLDGDCPYANSYWDGTQMVFGDGFPSAPDVVAHEYTHGVTQYTSGLLYYYQSGSINESMSDVMGELFDQYNGTDTDGQWMFGEKLASGLQRNMADPTPERPGRAAGLDEQRSVEHRRIRQRRRPHRQRRRQQARLPRGRGRHVQRRHRRRASRTTARPTPNMIQKMAKIWLTADSILTPAADYADLGNAVAGRLRTLLASADGRHRRGRLHVGHERGRRDAARVDHVVAPAGADGGLLAPATTRAPRSRTTSTGHPAPTLGPIWYELGTGRDRQLRGTDRRRR